MYEVTPDEKLNGLKELSVAYRSLKKCKWYEIGKKRNLNALIKHIKLIYEL